MRMVSSFCVYVKVNLYSFKKSIYIHFIMELELDSYFGLYYRLHLIDHR